MWGRPSFARALIICSRFPTVLKLTGIVTASLFQRLPSIVQPGWQKPESIDLKTCIIEPVVFERLPRTTLRTGTTGFFFALVVNWRV